MSNHPPARPTTAKHAEDREEESDATGTPRRFVPRRAFPPYAFVPGKSPHPTADTQGHSYGKLPEVPACPVPQEWRSNVTYLYGIDLFNAGYYW